MERQNFVLKGNLCYSLDEKNLLVVEQGYLVYEGGASAGVYETLPEEYRQYPVMDYGNKLIVPGLVNLYAHAPQYASYGPGMDMELLDRLNTHTFPEEAKYRNLKYAASAYGVFAEQMKHSATTRACIFATVHRKTIELSMDLMEETGLKIMVGEVNTDRNTPDYLAEGDMPQSAGDTTRWLDESAGRYERTKPTLTPRFILSVTNDLTGGLNVIRKRYHLPVQSHLSKNQGEIAWVKEFCPWPSCHGDAYDKQGMFGRDGDGYECKTIMAHCVYSGEEERKLLEECGVYVAHCPRSNTNLVSGITPARRYLEGGIHIGFGSDAAGEFTESIFRVMADVVQVSKLYWGLADESAEPFIMEEAFYMGIKGGGSFSGKVGSFEKGYELDAVILDDAKPRHPQPLEIKERLERFIYLSDERHIVGKYVTRSKIF